MGAMLATASQPALAQIPVPAAPATQSSPAYQPPRLADDHPDLEGVWSYKFLSPLEASPIGKDLVVSPERAKMAVALIRSVARSLGEAALDPEAVDPDAHALAVVRGEHRTRLIVEPPDGKLPYTPEARAQVSARQMLFAQQVMGKSSDGPETRLTWERCLAAMGQAPLMTSWAIAMHRRIVQTPDALVIWSEAGGETRIVRIGDQHRPPAIRSFLGDSIGRWDGDTLVVETAGFRSDDIFRLVPPGRPLVVGPDSKVIERFSRIGPDELLYQFTVEDPAIYAAPWLGEYSMRTTTEPTYEFACHEGNYGLPNILKGTRKAEAVR